MAPFFIGDSQMLRKRYPFLDQAGDGTNGGSGAAPAPAAAPAAPPAAETFSATYVKELRQESAGDRLRAQEAERKAAEAAEAAKKADEAAAGKIKEANEAAQLRVIKAELKAVAVKAGIVDLDGLAFLDMAKVKLTDTGDIEGADEAIEALRKAKPYLFTKTTASTEKPPKGAPTTPKKVTDMSEAEYRAEKRRLGL